MKNILALIALIGLVSGCITPREGDFATDIDPNTGLRTDLMSNNLLDVSGQPKELLWLNASRVFKNRLERSYYLDARYMTSKEMGWLGIEPGQTLTLVVDGGEMRFTGPGSVRSRKTYDKDFVVETAIYEVTPEQLKAIAKAKQVKARLKGSNRTVEREFQAENFERFQDFVRNFVQ